MKIRALCITSSRDFEKFASSISSIIPTSLVIDWGCAGVLPVASVLRCELFALWREMLLAWENGYKEVVCETDNIEVFMISQRFQDSEAVLNKDLIAKIRELLQRSWWIEICLIQRIANRVADAMAKTAANHLLPHAEWLHLWSDLVSILQQDLSPP
ncbi:hypothetical protein PIB30_018486 [Stylosanthes scabra]|uniref:RNase H type-1 domain-containing protein n=1 Tax=Stylosanthes scabra TaxID=79078 RepID=A0ABU6W9W1_9FABA|nr:hypothetical protein [Stylosanthes scabra]